MYTIKTMNAISPVGLAKLPANQFEINNEANDAQGILVRSADLHDVALPKSLLAIARAGAGTNNIPIDQCTEQGIVVFNTPGANANAVAELVIGALVSGSRNVPDAVQWAQGLKGSATLAKDVVPALPTPPLPWAWKFWAMTHTFPLTLHGACPAAYSTASPWAICCPAATI